MSVGQFIKDYGTMAGCFALAASVTYATYAVTSRFDEVKDMAREMRETVAEVNVVREELKKDVAAMKEGLPDFGVTAGEATGNAVNKLDDMLTCPEDRPDCKRGKISDAVKNRIEGLRP
jgi:hypothetical protein